MPQAPEYLRDKFDGDAEAFKILGDDFKVSRGGIIYPAKEGTRPTIEQGHAIDYLILEWDYGYSSIRPPQGNHNG